MWTHGLTAYRQRLPDGTETPSDAAWKELVAHVTPELLTRLLGGDGCWRMDTTSVPVGRGDGDGDGDDDDDDNDMRGLPAVAGEDSAARIRYTPVDLKRTWPAGTVGRARTEMARDRSWALERALGLAQGVGGASEGAQGAQGAAQEQGAAQRAAQGAAHGSQRPPEPPGPAEMALLGELEVAFVACVYLGNYASRGQWLRLVRLLLTCRAAAVGAREDLFVECLAVLRRQLDVLAALAGDGGGDGGDAGLLGDEVLAQLQRLLRAFGTVLREEADDDPARGQRVRAAFAALAVRTARRLDWVLDARHILRRGTVQTEEGDLVDVAEDGLEAEEETGEYAPAVVTCPTTNGPPPE